MPDNNRIKIMRRCLDLAAGGEGLTYPNPLVGSVIVCNDSIIGEGFHVRAGEPHAEVNAVSVVRDKSLLASSTLYVNLEPCSHYGKTPPCTELIISSGIKKVVIGTTDTSEKVAGKGIARLKAAGCDVITGVLEDECRRINHRFFTFNEKKRPYIILKWAQSTDGFLDVERNTWGSDRPIWITGNTERVLVHKWRAMEQSILVGGETIRADNPELNTRYWTGNDPVRLILSGSGNINEGSKIFKVKGTNIVFTKNTEAKFPGAGIVSLTDKGPSASQICSYLYDTGIQSLLVEGGALVLRHFIESGLWDEARIFSGKAYFKSGVKAPEISGTEVSKTGFSESDLMVIFNSDR